MDSCYLHVEIDGRTGPSELCEETGEHMSEKCSRQVSSEQDGLV